MKLKIIIVIQTILIIFFVAIATIRTGDAEKATARAEQLAEKAVYLQKAAQNEVEKAERAAAAQAIISEIALEKCLKGN